MSADTRVNQSMIRYEFVPCKREPGSATKTPASNFGIDFLARHFQSSEQATLHIRLSFSAHLHLFMEQLVLCMTRGILSMRTRQRLKGILGFTRTRSTFHLGCKPMIRRPLHEADPLTTVKRNEYGEPALRMQRLAPMSRGGIHTTEFGRTDFHHLADPS